MITIVMASIYDDGSNDDMTDDPNSQIFTVATSFQHCQSTLMIIGQQTVILRKENGH